MHFNEDIPLGEDFENNPLQFMTNYVRNMNNEMFLSQYHINHLYALLLLGRSTPWDSFKPNALHVNANITQLLETKIAEVKFVLKNLSLVYEQKVKKGTINQIETLMNVIKAKSKSVYIQKKPLCAHHCHHHHHSKQETKLKPQLKSESEGKEQNQARQDTVLRKEQAENNEQKDLNQETVEVKGQIKEQNQSQEKEGEQQIFAIVYSLTNFGNLAALAMNMGQNIEFNPVSRFVQFRISKNYIIKIKNNDVSSYDSVSTLKEVPSDLFIHHIFPFLTASQLFAVRAVSKEWAEYVKEAWHAIFKRQMFVQLMASEFTKEIQFHFKLIQLRNPFFQKITLLLHALLEIIQWTSVYEAVNANTVSTPLKRVLIVFLILLEEPITVRNVNEIDEALWNLHKHKVLDLKVRASQFISNFAGNTNLTINDLRTIKITLLDNPFMRGQQMNTDDKTPLLLSIFIKQLTLQQILRCHIIFAQQYLLLSKKKLDGIASRMPPHRGFLEGVYKMLLMKGVQPLKNIEQQCHTPDLQQILRSLFTPQEKNKPDLVVRGKNSQINFFIDKATKMDIILSTISAVRNSDNLTAQRQKGNQHQLLNEKYIEAPSNQNQSEGSKENNQQKEDKSDENPNGLK